MLWAITILNESELPRRRRLFVISDSNDVGSRHTYQEVIERARSGNVVVDALIGTAGRPGSEHALGRLANRTGGFFASDPGQSSTAVKTMVDRIRSTPVLRFSRTVETNARTSSIGLRINGTSGAEPVTASIPRTREHVEPSERIYGGMPPWLRAVALLALAVIGVLIIY